MYENWQLRMKGPHSIEEQVVKDIFDLLSTTNQVLDKMTGRDEIEEKLQEILVGYRNYCAKKDIDSAVDGLVSGITPFLTQALKGFIQQNMLPPIYSHAVKMSSPPANPPYTGVVP